MREWTRLIKFFLSISPSNSFYEDFSWVSITLPAFMRLSILYEAIIYHHQNPTMLLYSPLMLLLSHIMDIIANSVLKVEEEKKTLDKVVLVVKQAWIVWMKERPKMLNDWFEIFFHCAHNIFFYSLLLTHSSSASFFKHKMRRWLMVLLEKVPYNHCAACIDISNKGYHMTND